MEIVIDKIQFTFPQFADNPGQHAITILTNLAYAELAKLDKEFVRTYTATCEGYAWLGDLRVTILIRYI